MPIAPSRRCPLQAALQEPAIRVCWPYRGIGAILHQRLDGVLHIHFQPATGWTDVQTRRQLCIEPQASGRGGCSGPGDH